MNMRTGAAALHLWPSPRECRLGDSEGEAQRRCQEARGFEREEARAEGNIFIAEPYFQNKLKDER